MIYALILVLLVIGVTYQHDSITSTNSRLSFISRNKRLILLLSITIIPIVGLNVYRPVMHRFSPDEVLARSKKEGIHHEIRQAYRVNLKLHPDSIPLHFEYIDYLMINTVFGCDDSFEDDIFTNDLTKNLCKEYAHAKCEFLRSKKNLIKPISYVRSKVEFGTNRFENYVKGLKAFTSREYSRAESFFLEEKRLNANYGETYYYLFKIYKLTSDSKLNYFIQKNENARFIPKTELRYEYYRLGNYLDYLIVIFLDRYEDIRFTAFLGGLLISIFWLVYLRSLDIYHKEKWSDIILVFIGGILFTNLCIPLYDFAHNELHFFIENKGFNDFLYCTLVIGGSEEFVKLMPWVIFALVTKKIEEPYDLILYASVSALGFAFAENWEYLKDSENMVGRSITSTVAHMFDASIIAYTVILAKFKSKKTHWKIMLPIIGFVLAMLAHGFYDFWLISRSVSNYFFITIIFFILSLHIWFFMKNNAVNNSKYYDSRPFNADRPLNVLIFSVIGMLIFEFILISLETDVEKANMNLAYESVLVLVFLVYMMVMLKNFKPVKGIWARYNIPVPMRIKEVFSTTFPIPEGQFSSANHLGLDLRLFVQKSNTYVGHFFPLVGTCNEMVSVNNHANWYVFHINKQIIFNNVVSDKVIIKSKFSHNKLTDDKIEIYMFLIPREEILTQKNIKVKDLLYVGRAFSRQIN